MTNTTLMSLSKFPVDLFGRGEQKYFYLGTTLTPCEGYVDAETQLFLAGEIDHEQYEERIGRALILDGDVSLDEDQGESQFHVFECEGPHFTERRSVVARSRPEAEVLFEDNYSTNHCIVRYVGVRD